MSKTIVIQPGGYHPFHAGHYALYKSAVEAFPGADVYVAATNDQKERPFPFAIKEKLAQIAGVAKGHFIQVTSPFKAAEITSHYNPHEDVLIFVRSEKDRNEQPKPGGMKKDGTPAYFQPYTGKNLQPFSKHAYMAYLPTVEFGPGITSATQIRTAWPTLNPTRKNAMVMSLYPAAKQNPQLTANIVKMMDLGMGGAASTLKEFALPGIDDGEDGSDLQLYVDVAKKLNMKRYEAGDAHDLIAKKMVGLVDEVDDEKVDYARHVARKAQGLPNMLDRHGLTESTLNEATGYETVDRLVKKLNKDISGIEYGPLKTKGPSMRVWTRRDGSRYRDPGLIQINQNMTTQDINRWEAEKPMEQFWKILITLGGKSIGSVLERGSSYPHRAITLGGQLFVNYDVVISWGSVSRLKQMWMAPEVTEELHEHGDKWEREVKGPFKVTSFDPHTGEINLEGAGTIKLSPNVKDTPKIGYNYAFEIQDGVASNLILLVVDTVIHTDQEVLMIRRKNNPFAGYWALPGGFIDPGETPEQAAIRELVEETGLEVTHVNPIGEFKTPGRDPRMMNTWSYAFSLHVTDKEQVRAGDDASETQWVPISRLSQLKLAFDHADILSSAGINVQNLSEEEEDPQLSKPIKPFNQVKQYPLTALL